MLLENIHHSLYIYLISQTIHFGDHYVKKILYRYLTYLYLNFFNFAFLRKNKDQQSCHFEKKKHKRKLKLTKSKRQKLT